MKYRNYLLFLSSFFFIFYFYCNNFREKIQKEKDAQIHIQWLKEREEKKLELERAWKPPSVYLIYKLFQFKYTFDVYNCYDFKLQLNLLLLGQNYKKIYIEETQVSQSHLQKLKVLSIVLRVKQCKLILQIQLMLKK